MKKNRYTFVQIAALVLAFLLLVGACILAYFFWQKWSGYKASEAMTETVFDTAVTIEEIAEIPNDNESVEDILLGEQPRALDVSPLRIDFQKLREFNKDICAWIYQPKTVINYPVVYSGDNEYYVERLLDGSPNASGTLFIDGYNANDFSDNNTIIYGHHMQNKTMFQTLANYTHNFIGPQQEYYEKHPYFYLNTPDQDYRLDVWSAYVTHDQNESYQKSFLSQSEYQLWLDMTKERSLINVDNVDVTTDDFVVTLSTCSYEESGSRTVVICKLVPIS